MTRRRPRRSRRRVGVARSGALLLLVGGSFLCGVASQVTPLPPGVIGLGFFVVVLVSAVRGGSRRH